MTQASAVAWFDDPVLVACLPAHLRAYAAYSRFALNRRTGRVLGGSFWLRVIRRVTPALHLPRDARVLVAGRIVHLDLTDPRFLWVLDEVRGCGHEHRIMRALLKPGDTFLDVGANHGSFAILASHLVGPGGRVVAVEPQARLAALIRRSLEEAPAPFAVHAVALGDREADMPLYVPRENSGAASLATAHREATPRVLVPVRRADDLLAWWSLPGSLMLKLDVEGSEPAFLLGATALIRERRPTILFELSAVQSRAAGHGPEEVISALRSLGYQRFAEVDQYPEEIRGPITDLERQRNLVAIP